jgi:hypothetical protein
MPADRDDVLPLEPEAPRLPATTTVERAFQLARTGSYRTIEDIGRQLKQEQKEAVDAHLAGASIRRDLRQICADTRTLRSMPRGPDERPV